jgi:hypothetical protein
MIYMKRKIYQRMIKRDLENKYSLLADFITAREYDYRNKL